jgi:hypothetical protein
MESLGQHQQAARQNPQALAELQKAEIEIWWPIINAAGIEAEMSRDFNCGSKTAMAAVRLERLQHLIHDFVHREVDRAGPSRDIFKTLPHRRKLVFNLKS